MINLKKKIKLISINSLIPTNNTLSNKIIIKETQTTMMTNIKTNITTISNHNITMKMMISMMTSMRKAMVWREVPLVNMWATVKPVKEQRKMPDCSKTESCSSN